MQDFEVTLSGAQRRILWSPGQGSKARFAAAAGVCVSTAQELALCLSRDVEAAVLRKACTLAQNLTSESAAGWPGPDWYPLHLSLTA